MRETPKPFSRKRLFAVIALFAFWCLVINARLVQFQVLQHEELSKHAVEMYTVTRPILVPRGVIYDSHMAQLATDVTASTVVAVPGNIRNIHDAAAKLGPLVEMEPGVLKNRLTDPVHKKRLIVRKRILPSVASRIRALKIAGIYLEDESLRIYPYGNLASHTLGFVNVAGNGVAGLEMKYDTELRGKQGKVVCEVDALGRSYSEELLVAPVPGHSLILSIDRSLQHLTQRELASGVQRFRATAGAAIVMEPETGRILALANYPDFDCSRYGHYSSELWRNRAVQDQFEPGSTLKIVAASAALDAGLVKPGEEIDCLMGSIMVGGHLFHDHKPFGLLTFQEILEYSSNIGAIKLGMRLGEERLYQSLRAFGFGSRTGIDLPAEATGLVRKRENWSGLSIASISFGQEIAVNSMQILTAINAIANGGYRVRPSVVDRIIDDGGKIIRASIPERTRIMSPKTAAILRNILEGVIFRGTGQRASLVGYRAAGKTGTAQKAEGGRFSKTKYLASFIGFAPLPQPRVTILVQIDEPRGAMYGGDVAAPIFQKIAQEVLLKLQVPQDWDLLLPKISSALRLSDSGSGSRTSE